MHIHVDIISYLYDNTKFIARSRSDSFESRKNYSGQVHVISDPDLSWNEYTWSDLRYSSKLNSGVGSKDFFYDTFWIKC